ncbi:aldolase-type tim barrel [Lucifera butyrica]|uniref:3-hexulose-6-phosphate synthase n=2 Tax=Lucifera butyrica TaxID=1351585 RepID=A0A498RAR9_9FIRM|nr:aldolase-type tim barrel [Lucifera butyrica]
MPKLQIALDNLSFPEAVKALRDVAAEIDVIEVGTILLCAEGKRAVEYLKTMYPDKIVLADAKIADAGKIITPMMFDAGADWATVICCAEIPTIAGALAVAKERGKDIQVELTGHWTFEQAAEWKKAGVGQVVYHRSRDAQAAGVNWGPADLEKVGRLCEMGFQVTVTGGVTVEDVRFFKELPIYVFIAGRSIRDAADPRQAARQFKEEFAKYW